MNPYVRAVLGGLLLVGFAGCDAPQGMRTSGGRTFVVQQWDTLWSVGGPQDTTLLRPFLITATDSTLYVYDGAARRVLALSTADGRQRWRYGRQGAWPDEFKGVRDLKRADDGGVYVLDPRNNRLTKLGRDGAVSARIPLGAVGHAEQLAPQPDGTVVLLTMRPDSAFAAVDSAGRVLRRLAVPWPEFAKLDALARQGITAVDSGRWVFGFSMGDGWFPFQRIKALGSARHYVEHREFPQTETHSQGDRSITRLSDTPCSACSLSLSGAIVYVHFGGSGEAPRRTLDRYDFGTGRYLGSYELPVEATAVDVRRDRVYVLSESPFPILLALRPNH